jgi:hypothetical protein
MVTTTNRKCNPECNCTATKSGKNLGALMGTPVIRNLDKTKMELRYSFKDYTQGSLNEIDAKLLAHLTNLITTAYEDGRDDMEVEAGHFWREIIKIRCKCRLSKGILHD